MEEFNYKSDKPIRSLRKAHEEEMKKCQRIPKHQLPNVKAGDTFSANGYEWRCVGVVPKYVYAKPITEWQDAGTDEVSFWKQRYLELKRQMKNMLDNLYD